MAEFENGQVETIGNIDDLDQWLDNLWGFRIVILA